MAKKFDYVALDRKVLVVAVEGEVKDWSAYCGAVTGNNHLLEAKEVARSGTKISKEIAELLFPTFRDLEWRY